MRNKALNAGELLSCIWAIHPRVMQGYTPTIVQLLKGDKTAAFGDMRDQIEYRNYRAAQGYAVNENGNWVKYFRSYKNGTGSKDFIIPSGSIGIVQVEGVIRQQTGWSNIGTEEYADQLKELGRNPNVKGVMLQVNSGGGEVHGTATFSEIVRNFEKKYKKPLEVYVHGMACSAAYHIISGASKIWGSGPSTEVGCIGTMITLYNWDKYLEIEGIEEIIIRAKKSFNKNEEYYQALQGNTGPMQSQILDKLNAGFLADVQKGRAGKLDIKMRVRSESGADVAEVLSGRTYYGKEAVKVGLIDKIGSEDQVFDSIARSAKNFKTIKVQQGMTIAEINQMSQESLTQTIARLEANKPLETAENFTEHMELLQFAQTRLQNIEQSTQINSLTAQVTQLQEADNSEELTQQIQTLTNERDENATNLEAANTRISELEGEVTTHEQTIATMEEAATEAQTNLDTANANVERLQNINQAQAGWIEQNFGQEVANGFVVGESGEVSQPEAYEPKTVFQSSADRRRTNTRKAMDIAGLGRNKED